MRFNGETVRILYHQIPTDKQLALCKVEETLAKDGIHMLVESVSLSETSGEISFRILFRSEHGASSDDILAFNQKPSLNER